MQDEKEDTEREREREGGSEKWTFFVGLPRGAGL